ncbi:MAG: YkgJ family cysteine cluster protein [Desulfobacterales bacterium]|nr:YkgJ family cysteine cluster protein [Desulfobacterales bacterium]
MSDFSIDHGSEVLMIYKEIDQRIGRFQVATGLFCPPGCGTCCESPNVEATALEVLSLAEEILLRREEERALNAIEEKENQGDLRCIHHRPDGPDSEKGKCSCYPLRPLVCRLFGFASRRNKFGEIELSTCKILKEKEPEAFRRAQIGLREGLKVPVYQDTFYRIASACPDKGFRSLPINQALKAALGYLYWKRPRGWRDAVAF